MTADTLSWNPCSACWAVLHRATPATHASQYRDGRVWCNEHKRPGDPALAGEISTSGAVEIVRAWRSASRGRGTKHADRDGDQLDRLQQ